MGTGPADMELGMNVVGQHEASTVHRARYRELRGREGLGRHGKLGGLRRERDETSGVGERDGDNERTHRGDARDRRSVPRVAQQESPPNEVVPGD